MKTGQPLITLSKITSTNEYASSLISENKAINGMVITACDQTKGKGQDQSTWESKAGENLILSIIVQPQSLLPARQFMLNKITSLAVRDFVFKKINTESIRIKWPNDIYIGDKKTAGILISNTIIGQEIKWSVVGIGININQTVFESDAPNPVSLAQISGQLYDLEDCLNMLCEIFNKRFEQLLMKKYDRIDKDYIDLMYRFGCWSGFVYKNKTITAKITGVGAFGHLLLELANGKTLSCDLKEVSFNKTQGN